MPRSTDSRRWRWLPLLLLLPMGVALLDRRACSERAVQQQAEHLPEEAAAPQVAQRSEPRAMRARRPPPPAPSDQPPSATPCAAYARKACHAGDVWWFDACGQPSERAEACEGRACLGVGCAPAAPVRDACGGVPAYGRCEGQVASACVGDQVFDVDCAAEGLRCVSTGEGARCLARSRFDCSPDEPATCHGDAVRSCIDGRWTEIDCAARLGRCAVSEGRAGCIGVRLAPVAKEPVERCDGVDEDLDGIVDEEGVCDPIPLVAFVAGGRVPDGFDAVLLRELATLDRVYHPLSFRWVEAVPESAPLELEPDKLGELSQRLSRSRKRPAREAAPGTAEPAVAQAEPGLEFYIPVLFVAELRTRPPTVGRSSLPNETCGGVRVSDRIVAPHGLVVVGEARMPETLAHEIGHYLGLCHTHDEITAFGLAEAASECQVTGDGVCDTPPDPGPERCTLRASCDSSCSDGRSRPDVSNVMSYYMPCRRGLSAEQHAIVTRGLALRRGWARCLDASACPCVPGEPGACPLGMSCRPPGDDGSGGACELDGPALPGAPCEDSAECSSQAVCVGAGSGAARRAHCARACVQSDEDCTCAGVGLPFRICLEDAG